MTDLAPSALLQASRRCVSSQWKLGETFGSPKSGRLLVAHAVSAALRVARVRGSDLKV